MSTNQKMTDGELVTYFDDFDLEDAENSGRSPLRALRWAVQAA